MIKKCSGCGIDKKLEEYSTNKKGKHGRYSVCRVCRRERQIQYRKDTDNAADKKWRRENKEKVKQYWKNHYFRYHEKHKKIGREKYRKMMKENPEVIRAYNRRYGKSLKGRYNSYKKGAKLRGHTFLISLVEFEKITNNQCHYCKDDTVKMGIDRINNSLGYFIENIVSCCWICNRMKMDMTKQELIKQCGKILKASLPNETDYS